MCTGGTGHLLLQVFLAQLSGRSATCGIRGSSPVCGPQQMLVALACDGCICEVQNQAATDGHVRLEREGVP